MLSARRSITLLTGQAPADAKQRFLKPGSLTPPRDINPRISPQVERAMLAAMAQHPDDRPASVEDFRRMLLCSCPSAIESLPSPAAAPPSRGLALSPDWSPQLLLRRGDPARHGSRCWSPSGRRCCRDALDSASQRLGFRPLHS